MRSDDAALKAGLWAVFILGVMTVGVIVGGPILALYVLIRGWDNTGFLVKLLTIVAPLTGAFIVVVNPNNNTWSDLEILWFIVSPLLTFAILFIAYARKDQMFNV